MDQVSSRVAVMTSSVAGSVFLCHASEDKEAVARPLAEGLRERGIPLWYDEFELEPGASLRQRIDQGLVRARFGLVLLSPSFFGKAWPERELAGLTTLQTQGLARLVPIWHEVGVREVTQYSPPLADLIALETRNGLGLLVARIAALVSESGQGDARGVKSALVGQVGVNHRRLAFMLGCSMGNRLAIMPTEAATAPTDALTELVGALQTLSVDGPASALLIEMVGELGSSNAEDADPTRLRARNLAVTQRFLEVVPAVEQEARDGMRPDDLDWFVLGQCLYEVAWSIILTENPAIGRVASKLEGGTSAWVGALAGLDLAVSRLDTPLTLQATLFAHTEMLQASPRPGWEQVWSATNTVAGAVDTFLRLSPTI